LDFATFYSKKLGMSAAALQRCLWGDYFYHPKTQSVSTKPPVTVGKGASPMFVQFVMEPIATIYKTLLIEQFEFFSE
jgi:ribosome assembly protein 1